MAEVTTTYQQSLEEYGKRHFRECCLGLIEGMHLALLRQVVLEVFGPEAAQALSPVLDEISDSKDTRALASAVFESATADEFIARLRSL